MYCDREKTDVTKSQAGFLKNIALPLYQAFNLYLESEMIRINCLEQLDANHDFWLSSSVNFE